MYDNRPEWTPLIPITIIYLLTTFFFIVFVTFLTLDLVVRGGRPADFPAAGLGDGQMLECNGNLDGVDVVVASCIYTSKGKESYASDQTLELHVNNNLMISNNEALLCTKHMPQSNVANKI